MPNLARFGRSQPFPGRQPAVPVIRRGAGSVIHNFSAGCFARLFIPHKDAIRGFAFDVATGKLNEVS